MGRIDGRGGDDSVKRRGAREGNRREERERKRAVNYGIGKESERSFEETSARGRG